MKTSLTVNQFFTAILRQLAAMKLDVERNPDNWHQTLQAAIESGAFLKLEFGFGSAGVVDAKLLLVSALGEEVLEVSTAGEPR